MCSGEVGLVAATELVAVVNRCPSRDAPEPGPGAYFHDAVWSEEVIDTKRQTLRARNCDRVGVLAIFCLSPADSTPRHRAKWATACLDAQWAHHDPSRIAFGRGNVDCVLHARRDHGELPDSEAELPFADQHEPFVRRF
jgi:hypothetical protein